MFNNIFSSGIGADDDKDVAMDKTKENLYIAIIFFLFGMVVPTYHLMQIHQMPNDLTILYEGVKKYKSEMGTYPKKLEDLTVTKDGYGPWIEKIPEDPYAGIGIYYRYKCNREGFVLFSVGNDGKVSSNIHDGILGDDKGYHEYNEE